MWTTVKIKKDTLKRLKHEATDRDIKLQDLLDRILMQWFWEKANDPLPEPPWEEGK